MKIKGIKIRDFQERLGKIPRILGENAFIAFLVFFGISLIFGVIVFYTYAVLAEKTEIGTIEKQLRFELGVYDKVLTVWQNDNDQAQRTANKSYLNLFSPK
jgi:hypothetical protein